MSNDELDIFIKMQLIEQSMKNSGLTVKKLIKNDIMLYINFVCSTISLEGKIHESCKVDLPTPDHP